MLTLVEDSPDTRTSAIPSAEEAHLWRGWGVAGGALISWTVETNELAGRGFRGSLRPAGGLSKDTREAQELGKEWRESPIGDQAEAP